MKKIAIIYSQYSPTIDSIKSRLNGIKIDLYTNHNFNGSEYDLIISVNFKEEIPFRTLYCHHSLLPAFNCNEPVKQAFLEGVKITGITIYFSNPRNIIFQYPLVIESDAHYDEIKQQLEYLEQSIYPVVIENILNNKPLNVKNLLGKSCKGNCNSCKGCER